MVTKPTFTLLAGGEAQDQQRLTKLFTKLTGREPTPKEMVDSAEQDENSGFAELPPVNLDNISD